MPEEPRRLLVPIPGACSELGGVSRTTIYELVKNGDLVKVNIGRRGFITGKSLAAYVNRLNTVKLSSNTADGESPTTSQAPAAPLKQ
jgi:hypothetical protein